MACPAQAMLSASGCIFLRSKPQASLVRGGVIGGVSSSSSRPFLLACNASSSPSPSSPPPAPAQEDSDCNEVECAPEKEVGSLSAEWLAEEKTRVVGTFPPRKKGWTGLVEKDTAGQTNIYSVEPMVYVAESAISSGTAGTSAEGAENTAAIAAGLVLITVAGAASILIQVNKNQPRVAEVPYSGPPLSYYVAKFQPAQEDSDCNEVECAPEKEVGSLSAEWLAEEKTRVVGTFPPRKKGWTGLVEKDTAGQTNIYSVEPMVYVAESAISSGTAGTSAEGAENTAAIAAGLVLITAASAASILIQVNKNQPRVAEVPYSGPPLSYYVAKFQPAAPPPPAETLEAPAPAEAVVAQDGAAAVEAAAPEAEQLPS